MDMESYEQGTQPTMGSTPVGIMRIGDSGEGSVVQLLLRGPDGDHTVFAQEGEAVPLPGQGALVVGAATPPGLRGTRWTIELGHRDEESPTSPE